jgi:signal transduction histidine kinase
MTAPALPRLLVVDDEGLNMRALCETLSMCGYETHGCTSGAQALEALRASPPFDLLLTDLMMPGMDGLELLRAAVARDPMLVAILMTGHGSIRTAVEAMQSGALDYIQKPFKLAAALPVLTRALKVRELRLANTRLEAELRDRMAELVAANQDLDAFSRSVSHDLRAPLHAIEGFSTALLSAHAGQLDEKGRHYLARIGAGVTRMNELIDGMLRLARAGRQPLARRTVNIVRLVEEVLHDLREVREFSCDRVSVDEALPDAHADSVLLRQVFANLLSNASKFSGKKPDARVDIGFEPVDGQGAYFVRDNGAGFDKAYADRMFEPFQRQHRAEEFPGLGVGLSIVHRIVTRHGGRLWADSEVGNGACFYFTLGAAEGGPGS